MSINTEEPNIKNSGMYFAFGFGAHFDICGMEEREFQSAATVQALSVLTKASV